VACGTGSSPARRARRRSRRQGGGHRSFRHRTVHGATDRSHQHRRLATVDDGGLPFDNGTFDVVACQHALHRFPDPLLILEEMRRVLAPGGRLGITTWGPIEENPAFAAELDATVKAGLDDSGVVDALLDAFAWHRTVDLKELANSAGLVDISCQTIRMLTALPRVAEWVRVYPSLPPLSQVWQHCDQQTRLQFLSRATELLRPFEHDSVLRVQASSRLLVARHPRS